MDDAVKIILKKLDDIDGRLKTLETGSEVKPITKVTSPTKIERDSLLPKAIEIMNKYEEISSLQLQDVLRIDKVRAEKLLDELEVAGYGTCYWKEI